MRTSKRVHFKMATLEASTNPQKNILAKRLVMAVRYVSNAKPRVISMEPIGIRKEKH